MAPWSSSHAPLGLLLTPVLTRSQNRGFSRRTVSRAQVMREDAAIPFISPLFPTISFLLQFVLKHKEFAHLREVEVFPNALNPHKEESRALVKAMIDQVMAQHEDLKWFHIGCDEVGLLLSQEGFFLVRNDGKG